MNIEVIEGGKHYYLQAETGTCLMDCLLKAGVMQATECAGRGVCGKCAVIVRSGKLEPMPGESSAQDLLKNGKALACRSLVLEDVVIEITSGRDDIDRKVRLPNLQKEKCFTDTLVEKKFVQLSPPTLRDQLSDAERLLAQIGKKKTLPLGLLRKLPELLRQSDYKVTVAQVDEQVVAVEAGDTTMHKYGFIIDIGTTTIAMYLVDLSSGDVLDAEGEANPQRPFGSDVLSRISAASSAPGQLEKLQAVTLDGISKVMRRLLRKHGFAEEHVYCLTVVGNTTMSHLFLGVDPKNLAVAPFIPCYRSRVTLKGAELGLPMNPEGAVHVLPNISGYVGSDTLGVAMATRMWEQKGYSLAVDIGTNGEILLGYKGWLLACSAAAGPAFEGAHIHNGMRAGEGAIEGVHIEDGALRLDIIGNSPPQGICGSGLIDGVAELLRAGLMDVRGRLADGAAEAVAAHPLRDRLREKDGIREFVLAFAGELGNEQDIAITQKDIRELQLAKAAIAAGISVLMQEVKIDASKVDRLFLAGAFGNYLDRENAVTLGMFPGIPSEKIIPIGNAAAEGAGLCLLSAEQRRTADRIAMFVKPVELSARADFNDQFVREINFPPPA